MIEFGSFVLAAYHKHISVVSGCPPSLSLVGIQPAHRDDLSANHHHLQSGRKMTDMHENIMNYNKHGIIFYANFPKSKTMLNACTDL